jgi:hypothetical protein
VVGGGCKEGAARRKVERRSASTKLEKNIIEKERS